MPKLMNLKVPETLEVIDIVKAYNINPGDWIEVNDTEFMMFDRDVDLYDLQKFITNTEIEYEDGKIIGYRGKPKEQQ